MTQPPPLTRPRGKPEWQRAIIAASAVVIAMSVMSVTYFARSILIPLALAIFFTFVLSPPVRLLQRKGVGRGPSVLLVVGLAAGLFVGTLYVIGMQMASLSRTLPEKEQQINAKIENVKGWVSGGEGSRMAEFLTRVQQLITSAPAAAVDTVVSSDGPPGPLGVNTNPPQQVVVTTAGEGWASRAEMFVAPLLEMVGQSAFAFVLVVFMLLKREDLRNRFLRLLGRDRMTTTTKAVDDASRRVARYLFVQLLLNAGFGLVVSVALFMLGLSYALLWGFLATLMRYVPYIGTWIGIIPPVVFSFAVSDGLWQPFAVFLVFVTLELICNNVFEPWLYGTSLGMSEVAQLVSAGLWAFLWGPLGLILSGPLTTCLLVLGKYSPQFRFLEVLLGDEPPLDASAAFYQRLTARDQDEASRILTQASAAAEPAVVFDTVVVPAIRLSREALDEGSLDLDDQRVMHASVRELIEDLPGPKASDETDTREPVRVLFCPARDDADQLVLQMLAHTLDDGRWDIKVAAEETLTAELMEEVRTFAPAVVCIGSLPPGGLAHSRYLCKRLRGRALDVKLAIGRWGGADDADDVKKELQDVGVDAIWHSLDAAREQLVNWLSVLRALHPNPAADGKPLVGTGAA